MVDNEEKIVAWVLGSGFSKSLGGPMLAELFGRQHEVAARGLLTTQMAEIYGLYRQCVERKYLEHAEQFLELIDTAAANPARDAMLKGIYSKFDPTDSKSHATMIVATECDFLHTLDLSEEGWQPYVNWHEDILGKNHYVISFNYDLVLESLGRQSLMPDAKTYKQPRRVLKLHGSIDWCRDGNTIKQKPLAKIRSEGTTPLIATPGPTKLRTTSDETLLRPLWGYAKNILTQAHVIVFLGYRFPPSDSYARSQLLGAIGANEVQNLRIHTVLGPDIKDAATVRLTKLLEHTLDRTRTHGHGLQYSLENQPLYAEDFLSVIHEQELYGSPAS